MRQAAQDLLDRLRGRHGSKVRALALLEAARTMSRSELDDLVDARLGDLLECARRDVPYHRERIDPTRGRRGVLTKPLVRRHFEDLISQRYPRDELLFSATGGSSGEPMPYGRDLEAQWVANVCEEQGYLRAGRPPGGRLLLVWGAALDVERDTASWRASWNRYVHGLAYLPAFELPDDVSGWVAELDRYKPHVLLGYSGALAAFAARVLAQGLQPKWRPNGLMASAETLAPEWRSDIERAFGAPLYDRYGSRELGNIAQECEQQDGLHVYEHARFVEILDPEDRPLPPGERGRIVVTDLWNRGFPLIRYDTGDVGSLSVGNCACGEASVRISAVEGRVTDFLIGEDGRSMSGLLLPHLLKDYPAVERFQALQALDGAVTLKLASRAGLSTADRNAIRQIIERHVSGVSVAVEMVDELPLPPSGKHRFVVSERSQSQLAQASS